VVMTTSILRLVSVSLCLLGFATGSRAGDVPGGGHAADELQRIQQVVQRNPGSVKARHRLASVFFKSGRFGEAAQAWSHLLTAGTFTMSPATRLLVGRSAAVASLKAGQTVNACKLARWCKAQAPDDPTIAALHDRIASIAKQRGTRPSPTANLKARARVDFDKGIEFYRLARIGFDPGSDTVTRQYTEAIQEFEKVLGTDYKPAQTQFYLGSSHLSRGKDGDVEKARAYLEESRRLDDIESRTLVDLGEVYGILGESEQEAGAYKGALDLDPDCDECHFRMALIYDQDSDEGSTDRIMTHASQAIRLNPGYKEPLMASVSHPEALARIAAIEIPKAPPPPDMSTSDGSSLPSGIDDSTRQEAEDALGGVNSIDDVKKLSQSDEMSERLRQKTGKSVEDWKKDKRVQKVLDDPKRLERYMKMAERFLSRRKKN